MRKVFCIRLIICSLLLCIGWTNPLDYVFDVFESPLIASGHPEYPPFMWKEGDLIAGASAEIIKIVMKQLDVPCEVRYEGSWDEVLKKAEEGKIDVIVGAFKKAERMKYMDYSIPYAEDPVMVFVKKGKEFSFKKLEDLIGRKGTTNPGESYGEMVDEFIDTKLNVKRLPIREGFKMLVDGKVDYLIISKYSGILETKRLGCFTDIEMLPKPVTIQKFYITFSKKAGRCNLLPDVNKKLEKMIFDGTVDKLIYKSQVYWMQNLL